MTKAYSLRALALSLIFVALGFVMAAMQYVVSFFNDGLRDSASMRVSTSNVCSNDDGAHFTGCSSIL